MSGLLRRIKRSRTADAGETPAEGRAARPEGAPTTAEATAGVDASSVKTLELPAAMPAGESIERVPHTPAGATAPAIHADPHRPAGQDPAEAGAAPPSGRRSRLRKRLRYLRRARELMLRDLGGLLYEVHRTAGGDVTGHSTVIGAKVERLARLDAESERIEAALGAPRSETVVFQPGVGGTCQVCGELYGSADHFCSNCGSPAGSAAPAAEPRPVPAMPKAPDGEGKAPADTTSAPAHELNAPRDETEAAAPTGELNSPAERADAQPAAGESRAETPADAPEAPGDPAPDEPGNPPSGLSNGRADDRKPPGLSSGDPLAARESGS
jgi:hypothetical protein